MTTALTIDIARSRILNLPGRPAFMLAADLAEFYEVSAKAIGQAVKRNLDRFPEDFCFSISAAEIDQKWSQNVTTSQGKRTDLLQLAFTEAGALALSGVLRSKRAAAVSVIIFRAFVAMTKQSFAEIRSLNHRALMFYKAQSRSHAMMAEGLRQGSSFADIRAAAPKSWSTERLAMAAMDCVLADPSLSLPRDMPVLRKPKPVQEPMPDLFAGV